MEAGERKDGTRSSSAEPAEKKKTNQEHDDGGLSFVVVSGGGGGACGGGAGRRRRSGGNSGEVPAAGEGSVVRLLQEELPAGGVGRQGLSGVGHQAEPRAPAGDHPHPLPRLLRAGLRRLRAAGQHDERRDVREGPDPQPDAPPRGVQGHQRHPRPPREGVRPRRLLRRHTRALRPRLRPAGWRPFVQGSPGPSRRPAPGEPVGRLRGPPGADVERDGPDGGAVQDQPGHDGPGGSLRRAHRGHRALRGLPEPALRPARPHHGPVVLLPAQADLPRPERRQHHRQRHPDAQRLRQQVLRRPAQQAGPLHLRPGPLRQRHNQAHRHQVRRRPGRLLRAVRLLVRQDGDDPGAHGRAGTGPRKLRRAQPRLLHWAPLVRRRRRREPRALDVV